MLGLEAKVEPHGNLSSEREVADLEIEVLLVKLIW